MVHAEYVDIGPTMSERPRLREMMREGAGPSRPFEVVMILEDSRFSGSADGFREIAGSLRRNPVELSTIT